MSEPPAHPEFVRPEPAKSLQEIFIPFDPELTVDPRSELYIARTDPELQKLCRELKRRTEPMHAFLCGHRGSGKTTELHRLRMDPEITSRYLPVYLTAQHFGSESVYLTHDALMVEIGLAIAREGKQHGLDSAFEGELHDWGREVVKLYLHDEEALAEAGAQGNAWLAWFKAQLKTRREWKTEQRQILEPRIQDLIGILNRMAQELKNRVKKRLLVVVDDLEKGESDAHQAMHKRLFQENYETLVQPRFSIVYVAPIYFRSLPGSRIPSDQLYAFSAIRLYAREEKGRDKPPLSREHPGYKMMRSFVEKRVEDADRLFAPDVLDELLRIGGGLFRETARAIYDAADFALDRGAERIELEDAREVYNHVKKDYQPMIRGDAVQVLHEVMESEQGWVPEVEPYLQSRAVVEYENGELWLDVRYPLKPYVRELRKQRPTDA